MSTTIAGCEWYDGRDVISLTSYGAICVEPADRQGQLVFYLPTVGTWFKDNWHIIFIIALVVALAIVAVSLQAIRWYRRLQHRHERAERDKRVDGMVRMVSSSFRFAPTASGRRARGVESSVKSTTSSSSSSGEYDDDDDDEMRGDGAAEMDVASLKDSSSRRHRRHH